MDIIIELSEKLNDGYFIAKEKGSSKPIFYGKTKKECITRAREYARTLRRERLKMIDEAGREFYTLKFHWIDENTYKRKC